MSTVKLRIYAILFFFLSLRGLSQPAGPPPPGDSDPPRTLSIDRELRTLLAAGVLLGAYTACKRKKN